MRFGPRTWPVLVFTSTVQPMRSMAHADHAKTSYLGLKLNVVCATSQVTSTLQDGCR